MDNLKGKRLLLLGGGSWATAIKAFAGANDITLIATGNDPHGGIFDIADESCHLDSTDVDAMKRLIREKGIDGVYLGGSEQVLSSAIQYVNELGYPCYCTNEQFKILQDKHRFKQLCLQFGLPCAQQFELDSTSIEYPVVTKPVDGCGSHGFSVCRNREELLEGFAKAKVASRSGQVLIEKFCTHNDSVHVCYFFSGGQAYFSSINSKYPVKYSDPECYLSALLLYESSHKDDFLKRYDGKLRKMFSHLGLKEGALNIEVFYDGDNYCFNEAGYRHYSRVSFFPINYCTGVNLLEMDIVYSLTGKSSLEGHTSLFPADVLRKKYYCIYCVQINDGRIATIEGVDEFQRSPECVFMSIAKRVGDEICGPRTLDLCFAYIHVVFDTVEELHQIIDKIHNTIHVTDTEGREMLVDMMDWENRNIVV